MVEQTLLDDFDDNIIQADLASIVPESDASGVFDQIEDDLFYDVDNDVFDEVVFQREQQQSKQRITLQIFLSQFDAEGTIWEDVEVVEDTEEAYIDWMVALYAVEEAELEFDEEDSETLFSQIIVILYTLIFALRDRIEWQRAEASMDIRIQTIFDAQETEFNATQQTIRTPESIRDDPLSKLLPNAVRSKLLPRRTLNRIASLQLHSEGKQQLIDVLSQLTNESNSIDAQQQAFDDLAMILQSNDFNIPRADSDAIQSEIYDELFGYGPLNPLLRDELISSIFINGPHEVLGEGDSEVDYNYIHFDDVEHLNRILTRIFAQMGVSPDGSQSVIRGRMIDGSAIHVVMPPIALSGPVVAIHKPVQAAMSAPNLIRLGVATEGMLEFLRACVLARLNIFVVGDPSSFKYSLAGVVAQFCQSSDRIISIETTAAIPINRPNVVKLTTNLGHMDDKISSTDVIDVALTMRPDRLIIGDLSTEEAPSLLDNLYRSNIGGIIALSPGSHPREALNILETMCQRDQPTRSQIGILEMIARAVDVIIHIERLQDGSRKITSIAEVQQVNEDSIQIETIFEFKQTGIEGVHPTGIRPKFITRIEEAGIYLPPSIFGMRQSQRF